MIYDDLYIYNDQIVIIDWIVDKVRNIHEHSIIIRLLSLFYLFFNHSISHALVNWLTDSS